MCKTSLKSEILILDLSSMPGEIRSRVPTVCLTWGPHPPTPLARKPAAWAPEVLSPLPIPNPGGAVYKSVDLLELPDRLSLPSGQDHSLDKFSPNTCLNRDSVFRSPPIPLPPNWDSLSEKSLCCPAWLTNLYGKPYAFKY